MSQADLEISLYRRDAESYGIELRFSDPDSETEKRQGGANPVRFDPVELRRRELDPAAYGQYLAAQLFAEPTLRSFFDQALAVAQAGDATLRLRLNIAPSAPELHNLRWETLRLPDAPAPLLTGENLLFSRYLSSLDLRPVRLRPESALRALVAMSDPANAAEYGLAHSLHRKQDRRIRRGAPMARALATTRTEGRSSTGRWQHKEPSRCLCAHVQFGHRVELRREEA